jgi:hypothetical protein
MDGAHPLTRIRAGQNIKHLRKQDGHPSTKGTLDIYGRLLNDAKPARQRMELLTLSIGKLNG